MIFVAESAPRTRGIAKVGGLVLLAALLGPLGACTKEKKGSHGKNESTAVAPAPATGASPAQAPGASPFPAAGTPSAAALAAAHATKALPVAPSVPEAATLMLSDILRDNRTFVAQHPPAYFARFKDMQHPRATVVACADSRFHGSAIDHLPDDDLFMIRNIGNVVDTVGGSVEYGVRHLHTPLLLIVGHVLCGSVKAAMSDYEAESMAIRREIDALHISLQRTAATGTFEERWLKNVSGNVHQQVRYALRTFAPEINAGTLAVLGAVYDFRDDFKQGPGRVHVINVNGETDPAKLANHDMLKKAHRLSQAPATPRGEVDVRGGNH